MKKKNYSSTHEAKRGRKKRRIKTTDEILMIIWRVELSTDIAFSRYGETIEL